MQAAMPHAATDVTPSSSPAMRPKIGRPPALPPVAPPPSAEIIPLPLKTEAQKTPLKPVHYRLAMGITLAVGALSLLLAIFLGGGAPDQDLALPLIEQTPSMALPSAPATLTNTDKARLLTLLRQE